MDRHRRDEYVVMLQAIDTLRELPVWPADSGDPHEHARLVRHAVDPVAWFDPDMDVRQAAAEIVPVADGLAATIRELRQGSPGHGATLTIPDREFYDAAAEPLTCAAHTLRLRAQRALGVID